MKLRQTVACIFCTVMLCYSACACSENNSETVTSVPAESSVTSAESVSSIPDKKESSTMSAPQSSAEVIGSSEYSVIDPSDMPAGMSKSGNYYTYRNSVLSLSVKFPDTFCVIDEDYQPDYGIYLQNDEGTATLLLQSVTDHHLNHKEMAAYLKEHYPDAEVYISDNREVICKLSTSDINGNSIMMFQKIKLQSGGYNEIVLCCREEEKSIYSNVFKKISFA